MQRPAAWKRLTGIKTGNKLKKGAVALRKMIQDIVGINHSSILYLVYVLLSATAPFLSYRKDGIDVLRQGSASGGCLLKFSSGTKIYITFRRIGVIS